MIFPFFWFSSYVYKTINAHIALVNIETWNERDMINVQTSAFATSDEFDQYNNDVQHTLLHDFHPLSLTYFSLPKGASEAYQVTL